MVAEPADEKRPESAAKGLRESLDQFLDLLDEHQLLPADTTDNRRAAFEAIVDSLRIPASVEARSEIEPGRKRRYCAQRRYGWRRLRANLGRRCE
jgi:hypothetical protein